MNNEIETAIKEYYELNKKIKELENRKFELKEVLFSALNSEHTNELKTEDILFYRVNRPRINWDESILKSILLPKGLWDLVLSVDTKKVRDLIESQVLSWQEIEKAKTTIDTWYTYAERVSKNQEIKPSIYLIPDEEIKGIKRLVITDLSRMKEGRVCIFGFDEEKRHIRPVIPYTGINESYIFNEESRQIIKPFAEVEFDFIRTMPEPPHTEDCVINTNYKPRLIRNLSENESKKFLEEILDESINTIFGAAIQDNRYIKTGGNRSIGTIKVKEVLSVNYFIKENDKYNYRMTFSDMSGDVYNLPITDCAFRKYCDNQRIQKGKNTDVISHELQRILNQSEVFLRVGLTRLYKDVYWLQVSGVHTFPSYGKEFNIELESQTLLEACHENELCSEIKKIDGTIIAQTIISCVSQVGESFGMSHIADVLCGSKSQKVIRNRHDTLTIYGAGKEYSREQWQDFIKELIQLGYLKSEGEIYPVIRQTQKSRDILSGKEGIFLTKPAEEVHIFDENFDRDLFEILRILRKKLADEESIPPYIIFHDSSLKAMATHFPQNPSDFQKISGVGERKLMKYGKLFLEEIISYYCKKHKIEPKAINALGYTPKTTTSTLQTPTNPKTERLGVDIVRVGMSKLDMIGTLKQIIIELRHDKEAAPLEDIISKAESAGIERDAIKDVIQLLKRTGEIYEVSNERFRIA